MLAGALALAGCKDELTIAEPGVATTKQFEALVPGIHPVFMTVDGAADDTETVSGPSREKRRFRSPGSGDTIRIEMFLHDVQVAGDLGSYQGTFAFDKNALRFIDAKIPAGLMAAYNEVEPGSIKVAGIAVDGLPKNGPVMSFRFVRTGSIELAPEQFAFTMTEVVAAHTLENLTEKVIKYQKPLFTAAPIVD
jgi:hypothetical protein